MKQERKQLLVKLLKEYKASKSIIKQGDWNGTADFIKKNKQQLKTAVLQLKQMHRNYYKIDWEAIQPKLDKAMSKYDKNVQRFIYDMVTSHYSNASIKEVAEFAMNNQTRYGTQAHFVLQAIGDYAYIAK